MGFGDPVMLALYFSPKGRIGRKSWWLGVLGLGVLGFALVAGLMLPAVWQGVSALDLDSLGGRKGAEQMLAFSRQIAWIGLICYAILAFPTFCLGIKRRHDRDNPGWDLVAYLVATPVVSLLPALGYGFEVVDTGGGFYAPAQTWWLTVLNSLVSLAGLYLFIMLGLAKGTQGPNSYGLDPLAPYGATA